ncbi:ribonuclease H-like domain-containing protein [Tanacetum coccineum]
MEHFRKIILKILAFRKELEEIALKHLGTVSENNSTSTPSVNTRSEPVNTSEFDPDDLAMPKLEIFHQSETGIFDEASYDEEGVVTDFNSLPTEIEVNPTPTLRIHNIHPKSEILGDLKSVVQTRSKFWVQAMQEIVYSLSATVWVLVDLPQGMKEEGIDYDEVFAHVARIEAIRLFLAFASFMGFVVYQMDVKSTFLYGTIDEEVYVSQPLVLLILIILRRFISVKTTITPWKTKMALTRKREWTDVNLKEVTSPSCEEGSSNTFRQPQFGLWFAEIVDFLRGSNLRYALTTNPTIYDFLVKQFWQTATATTLDDGTLEIKATVDTIEYIITEASIRDKLQLADASGITMLPNNEIFEGMGQIGGFRGVLRPLLPDMLLVATTNPSAGQDHPDVAQSQPSSSTIPVPSTSTQPHTFEEPSSAHQHFSPPQEHAQGQTTADDLLQLVPQLMTRVDNLEKDLKQTKLTMGSAIMKLVKKVKKLEGILKRRNVVLSDSEEEEPEAQGRKSQDDPLVSLVQGLVTPSKTTVNASGEEQVEDISPTTLEAAKTLSRVASQKLKSIDKGRRYKRRKETKGKKVVTSLDFQEEVSTGYAEGVNTGSIKVSTASGQEEASLTEAIRLDTLEKEEEAKQVHLDSLLAQRLAEEEELNEQQKQRRAQVQFEAQHYTNKDWDLIRAKIEANAELSKSVLGSSLQGEDFAKKMVDLVNQKKKHFAEQKARAKRNKPITQSLLRTYMMNYLKIQGTWKLFEAIKDSLKRFGEELQTETSKRLKSDEAKDDESTKKTRKRRKQIARKGLHTDMDKDDSEDLDEASEKDDSTSGTKIPINPVPVAMKSPSIANHKIIKQGRKGVYQIVKENGTDKVYISFGAMLTDISRDDLTELYRIVMRKHGMDKPEDKLEKVLWEYLKNMFEEPLSTDSIRSLPGLQRIICWRYYKACRVHCLNLESVDIYMLIERKYPLSTEVCKAMLNKKLQGGKPDEDCYKLLKMMEKQAGIRKHKDWLVQEQTALGKDFSNPLMADNLPKIIWLSTYHIWLVKSWLAHKFMDYGKGCGKTITSP